MSKEFQVLPTERAFLYLYLKYVRIHALEYLTKMSFVLGDFSRKD